MVTRSSQSGSISMLICLNRKPIRDTAVGGGMHFINAFCDVARIRGHGVVHQLSRDVDAVVVVDPRPTDDGMPSALDVKMWKKTHPDKRVLHRVNECDAKRGGVGTMDEYLRFTSEFSDTSVFVSDWMALYHLARGWRCPDTRVIINGIDRSVFKPCQPHERLSHKNGKTNIVTHHWSNNENKGEKLYEQLDAFVAENNDVFTYTFIGRTNARLSNTRRISPLPPFQLGVELAQYDVCINASMHDPGPNSTLESIACGLPTYVHVLGGGSVDFAGTDHVFSNHLDVARILQTGWHVPNTAIKLTDWETCIDGYLEALDG